MTEHFLVKDFKGHIYYVYLMALKYFDLQNTIGAEKKSNFEVGMEFWPSFALVL